MSEKKVGKRLLTWVLVLVMTLSLLPLNVLAEYSTSPASIFPPDTKCIVYTFYNGNEIVDKQEIKNNESLRVPATPEKEGYQFTGWFDQDENKFTGFGTAITVTEDSTDVDLYAKFVPVCYVYFMDGKGTDARIIATETLMPEGSLISEDFNRAALLVPVSAEQAVIGWTKDDKPVEEVSYVAGGSIYLYPIVANGHWITFDSKGGSYVAPQFVRSGESCTAPSDPTKPGYDFAGWYKDGTKFTFDSSLTENLTLTAHWTEKKDVQYTVIHRLENADDDGYSYKESVQMSGAAGFQTTATAKSYEGFTAQTITQRTIAGDGSTIVNVYYKRNLYTITFYLDNPIYTCGKEAHSHSWWNGCYNLRGKLTCTKEEHSHNSSCKTSTLTITAKYGANISNQWPTVNGSNTWRTEKSVGWGESHTYQVNIETMPLGDASFYGPKTADGSETAYYYVEVLPGETGGTQMSDGRSYKLKHQDTTSTDIRLKVTNEDRYPITGFTCNTELSAKNGDKYNGANFYYTRNSYDIIFINGGTKKTESQKYQQDISTVSYTPTAPAGKDGYVFDGWFDNELCEGTAYDFAKTMPANNITLYAKWEAPTFTVTVYNVDKTTTLKTFENVPLRGTISKDAMPTNKVTLADGDTFLGWTYEDGTPFNFNTEITKDIDLYARVGNKAGYSVTYVTEGSSPVTDDKLYAEGASATVLPGPTAPANKVFLGWTTEGGTTVEYYPNSSIKITGNVTLYAVYGDKAATVTVTYHSNFGTDSPYTTDAMPNNGKFTVADYKALGLPENNGYEFIGWSTNSGEQKVEFKKGESARADTNGSNDLYAQWKKTTIDEEVIVTITGNSDTKVYNGSEQSVTGFTTDVGEKDITVTLKEPGKGTAKGTNVGTYWMGLTPESFAVTSSTYTNIKVVVNDGKLEITPITDEVTVTINGNTDTKVYNASEQSVSGYTTDVNGKTISVALKEGSKAEAKGTDVNTYNMGLTADSFAVTSTNYSNIKVVVNDGYLEITPVTDEVTVTITGNTKTVMYNGSEQSVTGYTTDVGDKTIDVVLNATGKDTAKNTKVGKYYMGLTTNDFAVTSTNYTNINVIVVDGWLEITPITQTATVTITGNHNSVKYNGREQSVTGFTYTAPEGVTVTLNAGSKAEAKGTDKGTYYMGLTKDDFTVTSDIYKEFKIVVNDGYLEITRSGGHHPRPKPTVEIEDDDALGLNTTDHFAYIIGYGNGEVRPQNNITRAEVATIFFRLLTDDVRDENLTKTNRYSDVTRADWYNTAVSTLSSMGIITGYPDGTFRPNAAITRAEFAAIAARFDNDGDKTAAKFSDIASHWAKDEISIAYNNGWINGYPNGTFGPQRDITRAETMTLVNRVLNRQPETEDDLLPNMTVWTDNANPNAWYYLAVQEATNSHYYKFKTNSKYEKWTELRETRDWTQLEK